MALSTAHERALAGRSYLQTANLTIRNASGGIRVNRTFVTRAAPSHRLKYTLIRANGPEAPFFGTDGTTALWEIGRQKFQVIDGPNGTTYRELAPWESIQPSLIAPPGGAVFLVTSAMEVDGPTRRGGQPIVLESEHLRSPALLATAAGVSEPRNASFLAVITPDGLVRSYTLRFDAAAANRPVGVSISVRFSRLGDPSVVPPPPPSNLTG